MEECNFCLTKKSETKINMNYLRNMNIFFSNLILNKYVIKNGEIDKFNDILQSYYDEHKKKYNQFRIDIIWKKNVVIIKKDISSVHNHVYTNTYVQTNYGRKAVLCKSIIKRISKYD